MNYYEVRRPEHISGRGDDLITLCETSLKFILTSKTADWTKFLEGEHFCDFVSQLSDNNHLLQRRRLDA